MRRIVVIDDDRSVCEAFRMVFKGAYDIVTHPDGSSGLAAIRESPTDLVFLDILLGAQNGIDVLRSIQELPDPPAVVMVTATRTVKTAVEAIKLGAYEYVTKPWDLDELKLIVERAITARDTERDLTALREQVEQNRERFTQELERQVAERTRELEEANHKLRETHDQLVRSEKLASLGELVAGVAHELNNKLTPILSYTQLLGELDFPGRVPQYIQTIERSAESAAGVVRALLSFARQSAPERTEVDLNGVVEDTLVLIEYHLKSGSIRVQKNLELDLPVTLADDKQIGQVFLNIMNNACQAMGDRGGQLSLRSWSDEQSVHFAFEDTGPGIADADLQRIFDPFFTTKPIGKGTGLGLSVSYGIIQAHGGEIDVQSGIGKGTRFLITLPRVGSGSESSNGMLVQAATPDAAVRGRVLIVDDDADCRQTVEDILHDWHEVDVAEGADEAREVLAANGDFDAILLDCRMPGESGIDFYDWLRAHAPGQAQRAVFITGDYAKPEIQRFLQNCGCPWLPKPLEVNRLRAAVAEVLRPSGA